MHDLQPTGRRCTIPMQQQKCSRAYFLWCGLALVMGACDADGGDPPPTFAAVHERVLQPGCVFATCHKASATPGGSLSLERDVAHMNLVDVASAAVPDRLRVVAGDPDASYLLDKLTSMTPAAGTIMPPGAPLEAERIDLVRDWIAAGAADDE